MHRIVEGEKTRLRPASWGFSEEELQHRYEWSLDDTLQYWSGTIPGGRSFAQFKDAVGQRDWPSDGKRISYAILTKERELIGMVSCYNIDRRRHTGELGVYLGEQRFWGHGYGTDAIVAFLRHLFTDLDFESIYLHTYDSNTRAQKSYLRVGFEYDEKRRRFSPRIGYHEEIKMTITREAFTRLHGLQQPAAAP
ncbi:MAG TPA: GNAT family N-acetyltransferase [Chloroflexota bacterium]